MRVLIRQGEGPVASLQRITAERQALRRHLDEIARESEGVAMNAPDLSSTRRARAGATAAGDERRLRGIPVCARGVGGVVIGTDPLSELLRTNCD